MKGSLDGAHRRRCSLTGMVAVPVLGALLATTCTAGDVPETSLARARQVGLRVGFSIEPPFAFVDSAGEPRGEAPAMLRHVAGALAIDSLQWFPLEFDNLIAALEQGRIDVIASGLFITGERSRKVRFSRPTACLAPALVVRRDELFDRASACDTCRIAVIRGSVEQRALRAAADTGLTAPDVSTAVAAVKSGDAAALAISAPTARMLAESDSALALRDEVPAALRSARGCAALAFRPGDGALADAFDSVLAQLVGTESHQALVDKYGFTRREIVCAAGAPRGDGVEAAC